jgi:hypothetical protein
MKENKNYHGVTKATAESGYSDTMDKKPPASSDPFANLPAELEEEKQGFLERQNVFERI